MTQFEGQRYISLESFKQNGDGVKTPVWFIEESGKLYIWTLAHSGKVRRIRNNHKVHVSPSSARGKPKGNWIEAKARVLDLSDSAHPTELIREKYGLQFWLINRLHGKGRVIVELEQAQ